MLWVHPSLYSTTFPILKMIHSDILQFQQMMTRSALVLAKVVVYCLMPPCLFDQAQINDIIRDLNLPKQSCEMLAWRLQEKYLLHPGTNITFCRNREQGKFLVFHFQWWSDVFPWSKIPLRGNGLSWVCLPKVKNFKDDNETIAIARTPGHRKKRKVIVSLPFGWSIKVHSKPNLHRIG